MGLYSLSHVNVGIKKLSLKCSQHHCVAIYTSAASRAMSVPRRGDFAIVNGIIDVNGKLLDKG